MIKGAGLQSAVSISDAETGSKRDRSCGVDFLLCDPSLAKTSLIDRLPEHTSSITSKDVPNQWEHSHLSGLTNNAKSHAKHFNTPNSI